jgi:hypothetical protein
MACSMAGTTTNVFAVMNDDDDDTVGKDDDDSDIGNVDCDSGTSEDNDCNTKSGRNPPPPPIRSRGVDAQAIVLGGGGDGNTKHPPANMTPNAELNPPT